MDLDEFARLKNGDRIVVHFLKGPDAAVAHDEVLVVTGAPYEADTMIPAKSETSGKQWGICFRDIIGWTSNPTHRWMAEPNTLD